MARLGNTVRRWLTFLTRARRDDDLREEIETHVALRRDSLIANGMDPRDAAHEARKMFGNMNGIREETRDMWSVRWLDALLQDVRFGARLLLRTPIFTVTAVMSLGIGIGAAVAVFNVADAVLFRTLAVRAPGELRVLQGTLSAGAMRKGIAGADEETFDRIQRGADFADVIGFRLAPDIPLGVDGSAAGATRVAFVSANYFDVLGVRVLEGRPLSAADGAASPIPVLLSESRSGGETSVGRSLTLNGRPAVVVGIVRGFRGLVADQPADVFAPLAAAAAVDPALSNVVIRVVARMKSGTSPAVAEQKLLPLFMGPGPSVFRTENFHLTLADASRGIADSRGTMTRPLSLGLGLVAVLLLVACANTGGLLLSRFATRHGEFGIRLAIGAGRGRLARQLTVESLLLAALAAGAGLLAGAYAAPFLIRSIPQAGAQPAFDLRFDSRLVVFTAVVAIAAAFGAAAPSLVRLWRSNSGTLLSRETRTTVTGARRSTRVLIAAQVACSMLLIVGAVSMARTLLNLRHVPLGFDPERAMVVTVNAAGLVDASAVADFHGRLNQRLASSPGVVNATMAQVSPLTGAATTGTVDIAGFVPADDSDRVARMFFIGPRYFETLGMPIVAGRAILNTDGAARERVAVVNARFASFYFGSPGDALGRLVNRDVRIVGVVADARYNAARDEVPRAMFVPYAPAKRAQMSHIVRTSGDPAMAADSVRAAVSAHDPRLRPKIVMATELLGATLARERFFATIAVALSFLALLLACTGLYAAMTYAVSQRRAELAVRLALGASARDIMSLVLRDPLVTILAGVAAGFPAAYFVMRSMSSLLFDVSAFDPLTLTGCAALLIVVGLVAPLWPARRATRIDPVTALRNA